MQAHFLLGARHFLDQMMESFDGRPYPGDEAVVDAYISLVRDGLRRAALISLPRSTRQSESKRENAT